MHKQVVLILLVLVSADSDADFMYDFLRISCIQEANFLSIDYERIHNSAVERDFKPDYSTWEKHGYHKPSDMNYTCNLSKTAYKITASQANWRNGLCGAAPPVYFSVFKNGEVIIENVILGDSCLGNPSLSRVAILDWGEGESPDEMQICFQKNKRLKEPEIKCEWYFKNSIKNEDILPINNNLIFNVLDHENS